MTGKDPTRRIRSLHSKSRSGCGTCKIRHKRCDETHPACLNCTSTGRKCDGYEQVVDKRTREWRNAEFRDSFDNQTNFTLQYRYGSKVQPMVTTVPLPLATPYQIDLNWHERWHLDFYHHCIAVRLSHYFQNSYWSRLLFQMCQSQIALRHAAIAMSAWHTQPDRILRSHKDDSKPSLSLHHASKAISSLRESLTRSTFHSQSSNRTHKQVVLVTCLLFIVLASFQGDLHSARCHLASGYKLLIEWDFQKEKDSTVLVLRQAFAQLHVHWFFCSHSELFSQDFKVPHSEHWIPSSPSEALSKITTPRYSGFDQMDRVQEFFALIVGLILDFSASGFNIEPAGFISRDAAVLLSKVRFCRSCLMVVLLELNGLKPEDCDTLRVFSLWIEIMEIKIGVAQSLKPDEMVYDGYLEQFKRVTKLMQTIAGSRSGPSDIYFSPLAYRSSVFPTLVWTASKCRDWQIRRDICSMMDDQSGGDYWASATTAALKRMIDTESNGVKPGENIPEAARACVINVKIYTPESKVELRYRRPKHSPHLKHGSDEWESDIMSY
ncbi:unnamed protein product [Penicillium salamii]|nr:unnamed protein product [Penicillium salamii]CAG8416828.1 unnamed protein product [Penicillium salamii]